jgi:hypothetical protein
MSRRKKKHAVPTIKWIKCTDPFEVYNTTTNLGGIDWLISQPYRIDKGDLKIFYTKIGERFYGGYRYIDKKSEEELTEIIETRYFVGTIKEIDRTSEFMRYVSMGYPVMVSSGIKLTHDFVVNN